MLPESVLQFFAKYIESELGIIYSETNYYQLQNRLEEIAKLMGVADIRALYDQAQININGMFKQMLLDVATNNETSFFRDTKVFHAIENTVLPAFVANHRPEEKMSIWSAASSTGQEALSTCIAINEWNNRNKRDLNYSIVATDISERALGRARAAQYTQLEIQRGLPAPYMIKYFTKNEQDHWIAKGELTKRIDYRRLNLKDHFPFAQPFNLIMCRNVLIYQSIKSKIEILDRMAKLLAHDGYLILGSGESLLGLSNDFDHCMVEGVVIYRKKIAQSKVA